MFAKNFLFDYLYNNVIQIQLWDIRARGVVLEYEGNVNQYTRLPVYVDETENILYTGNSQNGTYK